MQPRNDSYTAKEKNCSKNSNSVMECNSENAEGVGLGRRGKKKWAGLVRLIASELCRKNKLSCRSRAALGWVRLQK